MSRRFSYFCEPLPPACTLTGYLANWKMFEPKSVRPDSIDACIAPIAVITEITEKTPIVIPSMVRAERSLFAPTEARAIVKISRNCMGKSECRISKSETITETRNSNSSFPAFPHDRPENFHQFVGFSEQTISGRFRFAIGID